MLPLITTTLTYFAISEILLRHNYDGKQDIFLLQILLSRDLCHYFLLWFKQNFCTIKENYKPKKIHVIETNNIFENIFTIFSETYPGLFQASKMERFMKIGNSSILSTIFVKSYIPHYWLDSEYPSDTTFFKKTIISLSHQEV